MSPLPGAWRGGLRLGSLSSDPTESEPACEGDWGQGQSKVEGEGNGGLCHLQYTKPQRCPGRSAGLTFICLIPEAIRQFSWETAAKIYICLSVST